MERVRQTLGGRQAAVAHGRVHELAHDGHPCARAADGRRLRGHVMDGILDRRAFPESHVVGLVAAGDEDCLRVADGLDHELVEHGVAVLEEATESHEHRS